ncbi:sialidase family protein [Ereboglobus luteus]|nr:sialidase family protein [Ereboglobus luteus]
MTSLKTFRLAAFYCIAMLSAACAAPRWEIVKSGFIEPAPPVAEVHSSSIVEIAPGKFIATWFGGSKEGHDDVEIWVSRYENGAWTPGVSVANGVQSDGKRHPTWNPVLYRAADGRVILFFKVGPSPTDWWGELLVSRDGGATWGNRSRLPKNLVGPVKNKPVRLKDGTLLCPSAREYNKNDWAICFERTDDSLVDWKKSDDVADPKKFRSIQPTILIQPDGSLMALSRSANREISRTWSRDGGKTWTPLSGTGIASINSGIDAIALREGGMLLVYNPRVASDKSKWGARCPLVVDYSMDGEAWERAITLENVPVRNGYAYPAIIQAQDGRVHITYTWNRARIKHVVLERK